MSTFAKIQHCRVCAAEQLELILALGEQPLANSLKNAQNETEKKYPLTLVFCRNCSLVQLQETVAKEALFRKYVWVTGTSATARQFAEEFCDKAIEFSGANPKSDLILEVASNDGTFLKPFRNRGYRVLGVDPAENICELAEKDGISSLAEFWNSATAVKVKREIASPKVIFARNVIPHVAELKDVIQGIKDALAADGTGIIEFHYSRKIFTELQYDSIYHEHLSYFSIQTMETLLKQFNLHTFHIETSPISGGALIVYFGHQQKPQTANYVRLVKEENEISLNSLSTWQSFGERCRQHREKSAALLKPFKGKCVVAFGASARSSTYLNFCGFDYTQIDSVIDNSPQKQHLFTAGSSISIVTMNEGLAKKPDLLFLLAWNFTQEILGLLREHGYRGQVLIPFPGDPKIISL